MWRLLLFPEDGAPTLELIPFPSQGPGISGSQGRLFLKLTAGFSPGCWYVHVETLGLFCRHLEQTFQMSRDGS